MDSLCEKTMLAAKDTGLHTLCLAGGVSANRLLRAADGGAGGERGITLCMPAVELCTDNAAMIASAAYLPPGADRGAFPERRARAPAGVGVQS